MKNLYFFLVLSTFSIFSTSCSKEQRIEETLWKGNGKWDIVSFRIDNFYDNEYVRSSLNEITGYFHFDKNGKGKQVFIFRSDTNTLSFTWSNSNDELFITFGSTVYTYKILSCSRNFTVIQEIQESIDNGKMVKKIITIILEKSK